jgi:hypothetical protein
MADVADTLAEWSSTTASNAPDGTASIGTGLDDNLREIQGVIVRGLSHKGSDIASANGAIDIGAVEGLMHDITGALTITGFGTVRAGILKVLKFEGAATLTYNATSLILPGAANIVCANGDVGIFISEGSGNWRCLAFTRTSGSVVTTGTEQASTSGTSITFTGIPAWARRVVINFAGVSTNGTSNYLIQIGPSGGVETTGYLGSGADLANSASVSAATNTAGFLIPVGAAAAIVHGSVTLTCEDVANFTWCASGVLARSDAASLSIVAGSKSTAAVMDRLSITTVNGTDAFDAGAINISFY